MFNLVSKLVSIQSNKKEFCIILLGAVFKLFLGIYFLNGSDIFFNYLNFANSFLDSNSYSPYSEVFQANHSFAYPSIILYLLITSLWFADFLGVSELSFAAFFFSILFILFDLITLKVMSYWVGEQNRTPLLFLYWLSPVLIYLSFVLGSFDVLVLCLFFLALDYLFKRKLLKSSIIMGLAVSTKTVVVLVMPFILLYLLSNRYRFAKIILYFITIFVTFILVNIQFITTDGFFETIFINSGQARVLDSFLLIGNSKFYLIPGILILILFRGLLIKNFNKDLFIIYLAFAFGLFLIFLYPEKYWYYWLLPHLLYFYAKIRGRSIYLFYTLQFAFFFYFFGAESTSLNHFALMESLNMLSYTFLQIVLLCNIFWVYYNGVQVFQNKKLYSKPFIAGIGGNSGTGKTTLSNSFEAIFSTNFSCSIKGDDIHKWKRGDLNWNKYTHLNPKANLIHDEINTLKTLKMNKDIVRDSYNHHTGNFDKDILVRPKNLIIYEGLHPFFLENQRNEYDLKIMILPEETLNFHWKIIRDNLKRKKTKQQVLDQINDRESDYKKFIMPQVDYADIVIKPYPSKEIDRVGNKDEKVDICYELTLNSSISLDYYFEILAGFRNIKFKHSYNENGSQTIDLTGKISQHELNEINKFNYEFLNDLGATLPIFPKGLYGLMVSILTYIIIIKAKS